MIELIGWLASVCFAICGAPQAYQSWKQGHSQGVDTLFLMLWLAGEVLMMIYVPLGPGWDWPIMFNLMLNFCFICVIIKYKFWPEERCK